MQLRVVNHLWLRLSSGNLCNPKKQAAKRRYMKWWAFSDHFFLLLSSNFVQLNVVPGTRIFVGKGPESGLLERRIVRQATHKCQTWRPFWAREEDVPTVPRGRTLRAVRDDNWQRD